ncbi:MAG TPA: hypothetical protein DGT23_12825, partial [Micromonosporaceae bacterium]|nr:hypothetical protein [Micromonosporaceae bacterium]
MQLRGRDLRAGMAGLDIGDLHQDLMRLGYAIPSGERAEQIFGVVTAQSVAAFQTAHGLTDNAVVDETTAAALNRAVAESAEQTLLVPPPKPHLKDLPPLREPDPPSDPVVSRGSVYSGRAVVDEPAPVAATAASSAEPAASP